jgi:hypothetical protein
MKVNELCAPSESRMFGLERRPNGYAIVTAYLRNSVGPSVLKAAHVTATATAGLSERDAVWVCTQLESWYGAQPVVSRYMERKADR